MKAKLVLCCILKIASSGKFSQNASYHSKSFKELKSELSRIPDQFLLTETAIETFLENNCTF